MFHLFRRRGQSKPPLPERATKEQHLSDNRVVEIQGRRFLRNAAYVLPKDLKEINRLDFQHYLLRQALKGNYLAPLGGNPGPILDVGCGSGIWGKEMALTFPNETVVNLDLEQAPNSGPTPANFTFIRGSILETLPFPNEQFGFVHQRLLISAIPAPNWAGVIRELQRVTRPGGYIELVECTFEGVRLGPLTRQFFTWGERVFSARGIDTQIIPTLGTLFQDAGMQTVQERIFDLPLGAWGGRIGGLLQENQLSVFQSMKPAFTRDGNEKEFDMLIAQMPQEWKQYHSLFRFYVFFGQK